MVLPVSVRVGFVPLLQIWADPDVIAILPATDSGFTTNRPVDDITPHPPVKITV